MLWGKPTAAAYEKHADEGGTHLKLSNTSLLYASLILTHSKSSDGHSIA